MSAVMVAVLKCDHPGCTASYTFVPEKSVPWKPPRLTDVRREMRAHSWRHGVRLRVDAGPAPSFDFCPDHADDVRDFSEVSL